MKRMIPLLALAVVLCLFAVPDASASCWRCSAGLEKCVYVNHPGWYNCTWIPAENWCDLENECEPFGITESVAPLASEYTVETVEVLDDKPAAAEKTADAALLEQHID